MKQLNKSDVLRVALQLIKINGQTTTLEIKNELRIQQFDGYQDEVSEYMRSLSTQYGWQVTQATNYRVYSWSNSPPQIVIWWILYKKNIYRFAFIFLLIVNAILWLYFVFTTYQWWRNPENNQLEPYIALIAVISSMLQWLIAKLNPNALNN